MDETGQGKPDKQYSVFIAGASGSIGRACAIRLAGPGNVLLLHGGHDAEKLEEVALVCRERGAEVHTFVLAYQSTVQFLSSIPETYNPDIVIVCFGPWLRGNLASMRTEDWVYLCDANLALPGAIVSRFGPGMAKRGFGRMVLFGASTSDRIQPYKTIAAYAAAKTGLGVIAKSAAREWGGNGVSVNVVCPGYVEGSSGLLRQDLDKMPGGKLQNADDIAVIVEFLCKGETIALNGAIVNSGAGL